MRPRPSHRDANAGTTLSRIIAAISAGTPGNEINIAPRHVTQNPGADPTGLGTTVAPDGINACRSCPLLGDRPHCANRIRMASNASFRRASLRPAASAMASRVQSSTVGPRPPVITMISARDTADFSARTMSARSSPTTDLKRTSMPKVPSSSVMNNELLSVRPPNRSSEPIAMISAMTGRGEERALPMGISVTGRSNELLLYLRKIERKRHLTAVSGKDGNRGLCCRIEVGISKGGHDFGFEARCLRIGGTAARHPVEPHGHGFDGFARLVEHHVTIDGEVANITENSGTDQHSLALERLGNIGLCGFDPSQSHVRGHDGKRGELCNQKAVWMQLIGGTEEGIEGIRRAMLSGRIGSSVERGADLLLGWLDLDRTHCGRCKNRKGGRPDGRGHVP